MALPKPIAFAIYKQAAMNALDEFKETGNSDAALSAVRLHCETGLALPDELTQWLATTIRCIQSGVDANKAMGLSDHKGSRRAATERQTEHAKEIIIDLMFRLVIDCGAPVSLASRLVQAKLDNDQALIQANQNKKVFPDCFDSVPQAETIRRYWYAFEDRNNELLEQSEEARNRDKEFLHHFLSFTLETKDRADLVKLIKEN